jgi:hypothetical protein
MEDTLHAIFWSCDMFDQLFPKSAGFSAAADATRVSVVIGLFKVLHKILSWSL